jgi:DNA-binding beta-propeller fold protein YncE
MNITVGDLTFEWIENWAQLPPMTGFAHHGFAVAADGTLVTGHATDPKILVLSPEGELLREFAVPVTETHGITLSQENGTEILWIVDTGSKYGRDPVGPAQVLKCTMQGEVLARLEKADFNYADEDAFCPTALAVDPATEQVWITDGYGSSRVHRFSPDLELELTLTGAEGDAGPFNQPHWIFADTRSGRTRIYVADRRSDRVQVFDTDGRFIKVIHEGVITPSVFGAFDEYLVVGELNARLVILDGNDKFVGTIGEGHKYLERTGWPNREGSDGSMVSPLDDIDPYTFNSPHGIAVDADGSIYVSEWLIGDRYTRLKRT